MHIVNRNRALDNQRDLPLDLAATLDPARAHVAAPLAVPEAQSERRDRPLADAVRACCGCSGGLGSSGSGGAQDCGLLGGDAGGVGGSEAAGRAGGGGDAGGGDASCLW